MHLLLGVASFIFRKPIVGLYSAGRRVPDSGIICLTLNADADYQSIL